MHSATPALIVVALLNACIWSGLLWQLWALRHSFEIAARAPVLVGISGVGALTLVLAIFVHWILLLESNGLPCYVMLLASYFCEYASFISFGVKASFFNVAQQFYSNLSRTHWLGLRRNKAHNFISQ